MMKNRGLGLRVFALCLLALYLGGCAHVEPSPAPAISLFRDELFKPQAEPIDPEAVFALSPAMRDYVDNEVSHLLRSRGLREGLLEALYTKGQLQLEYDADQTRTASQAFADKRGNCLSLVIMTGAFARHLNLPVRYQSVFLDDFWARKGDMYFLTGHVNLSLARRRAEPNSFSGDDGSMMVVDFLPGVELRGQRSREIDEHTVVAMYMNNRAAESLARNEVDAAYWWVKAALRADGRLLSAYNTLGVIYRRHGEPALAQASFRHVLSVEAENTQALSNLLLVLAEQGQSRLPEAQILEAKLRELQPYPPYKFFDEGVAAMRRGEYQQAKALFERELARSAYFHEFHFWAALANYGLGDVQAAHKHMAQALENSSNERERQMYSAKLDLLKTSRKSSNKTIGSVR